MECFRSYLFISVINVGVSEIAEALFTKISMPPNFSTALLRQSLTWSSNLISHFRASA